jgi:hypothetical protein
MPTVTLSLGERVRVSCADHPRRRRFAAHDGIVLGRVAEERATNDGGDQVGGAERQEDLGDVARVDKPPGHGRGDQRTGAEPAHGNSGDQPPPVREPLHEHRDRHDVAGTEADASDHAVGQHQEPELIRRLDQRSEHDAGGVDGPAGQSDRSRANAVLEAPAHQGTEEQHPDGHDERQGCLGPRPAHLVSERRDENTPRVDRPEGELDEDSGPGQ